MNLGYCKANDFNNPINNEVCPLCGQHIYVSKYYNDFACTDIDCPLGEGAIKLVNKIKPLLEMLK